MSLPCFNLSKNNSVKGLTTSKIKDNANIPNKKNRIA